MLESQFDAWTTADLAGQCRMQAREFLDPEHSAFMLSVAKRLTALAEAEARGRRQGLPDLTDMQVDMLSVQLATALLQTAPMEPGRIDPLRRVRPMVRDLYETIRSLATAPAETQKPETGESVR